LQIASDPLGLFAIFVFIITENSLNYSMMREFKKPDLNAPRYRPKVLSVLNKDLWKAFKEKYPKYKDVTYTTFKKIINEGNKVIWENVIELRDGVELPESLGYIFIGTCTLKKKDRENVDYGKSIKYGTRVTNRNWESDGKLAKIFYTNYAVKYKVQDRQIWNFVPCRTFKRTVAKTYPENWTKYVQVENNIRITKMYTALTLNQLAQRNTERDIQNYNEFDI